ncbi:hypothetical protein ABKN59_011605 [Abortiporus biennis]
MPSNTNNKRTSASVSVATSKVDNKAGAAPTDLGSPVNAPASTLDTMLLHGDSKVARAVDHGRQRVKKNERTQTWKAWKTIKAEARIVKKEQQRLQQQQQLMQSQSHTLVLPIQREKGDEKEKKKGGHVSSTGMTRKVVSGPSAAVGRAELDDWECEDDSSSAEMEDEFVDEKRASERSVEIDIIAFARPSKPKKSKAGDFELIAHPRSVIILDDQTNTDFELDDPWEYISTVTDDDLQDKAAPLSYADVVNAGIHSR